MSSSPNDLYESFYASDSSITRNNELTTGEDIAEKLAAQYAGSECKAAIQRMSCQNMQKGMVMVCVYLVERLSTCSFELFVLVSWLLFMRRCSFMPLNLYFV